MSRYHFAIESTVPQGAEDQYVHNQLLVRVRLIAHVCDDVSGKRISLPDAFTYIESLVLPMDELDLLRRVRKRRITPPEEERWAS